MFWIQIRKEKAKPGRKVEHDGYIKTSCNQVKAPTDLVTKASLSERDVNVSWRLKVRELFYFAWIWTLYIALRLSGFLLLLGGLGSSQHLLLLLLLFNVFSFGILDFLFRTKFILINSQTSLTWRCSFYLNHFFKTNISIANCSFSIYN